MRPKQLLPLLGARTYSTADLGRRSFYALFALGDVRLSEHAVKGLSGEDFGYTRIPLTRHVSSVGTAQVEKKGLSAKSQI
jgi:hypothetical protein